MSSVIPKWQNLHADGAFWAHARTVQDFLAMVVAPGVSALDARIADLERSQDVSAAFELSDVQELREETMRAYALSLQATWERQLRGWVEACAREVGSLRAEDVRKADWVRLQAYFKTLRGLPMDEFAGFSELDLLQLVGNTCRHGDGVSCDRLKSRRPDLWSDPYRQGASGLMIDLALLRTFVAAIAEFWMDAEEIHANSLKAKHPSVVRRLAEAEGRWTSRSPPPSARGVKG